MVVIQSHNTLHGFYMGRGTDTASLEYNLLQQIMDMREEFLYDILLDLHKAYKSLDCDRCLRILTAYGVGPWAFYLLRRYWGILTIMAQARGHFGTPFKGYLGVTQGYLLSPKIFNVVVDAVL